MKTIRIKLNNTIVLLLSLSFCYSACSISDVSQNIETTIHGQIHEFHDSVEEFENEQKSSNPHQNESERNAYLSITGSYVDENGVLSESYCIYDLESGLLDEYYHVPATSSYPCCVCDMRNQIVYYSAAVPEEIEGHAFMSENVYAYNIDDGVIKQITDYGSFMNRMILTEERLYFCGGRRSMIGVEVGYIDLQTGEVVILDCYKDIKGLNVRDISYNYNLDELTLSWYSETEQNELNQIYYQEIEEIGNSALHQLAPSTLDQIDMKTGDIRTLAIFNDCRPNLLTVSQDGKKILLYVEESDDPIRLYEDGKINVLHYDGTALAALSQDGESIYFVRQLKKTLNGVPCCVIMRYDFASGEVEEMTEVPFYVNNMVLILQ